MLYGLVRVCVVCVPKIAPVAIDVMLMLDLCCSGGRPIARVWLVSVVWRCAATRPGVWW